MYEKILRCVQEMADGSPSSEAFLLVSQFGDLVDRFYTKLDSRKSRIVIHAEKQVQTSAAEFGGELSEGPSRQNIDLVDRSVGRSSRWSESQHSRASSGNDSNLNTENEQLKVKNELLEAKIKNLEKMLTEADNEKEMSETILQKSTGRASCHDDTLKSYEG